MKGFYYFAYGRLVRFLLRHAASIGVRLLRRQLRFHFTSHSAYGRQVFGLTSGDADRWAANRIRAAFASGGPAIQALVDLLIAPWLDDAPLA